jgi:hypothetical protein
VSAGTLRATRRTFLKGTGSGVIAALTIGFEWGGSTRRAAARSLSPKTAIEPCFAPNAFLRIGADDSVASPPSWRRSWMPIGPRCASKALRRM